MRKAGLANDNREWWGLQQSKEQMLALKTGCCDSDSMPSWNGRNLNVKGHTWILLATSSK